MTGTDWIAASAVIPLLLLSAFLSGSETALTAASRGRLHQLAKEGSVPARRVLRLLERPDETLGAILIGNNLVNVLAAALATSLLLRAYGESGVALATLVMTALIVVFAEIAPKTYAIGRPDATALRAGFPIRIMVSVLAPVLFVVRSFTRGMLGLMGVSPDPDRPVLAARQEVRGAIDLGHKSGAFVKGHRDMLVAALELERADVATVMTSRGDVDMLNADADPEDILDTCLQSTHTRLPVWRGTRDSILGVVHAKDLYRAVHEFRRTQGEGLEGFDVLSVATSPWFVPENRSLAAQMRAFQNRKSGMALVVDEYGDFQGIVTLEDIVEDIIGDVFDEHDTVENPVSRREDGTYVVDGSISIRDLNRLRDWSLPDVDATTLAGLVIHEARTIPSVGQAFHFHGFRFVILQRERNRITRILVRPLASMDSDSD